MAPRETEDNAYAKFWGDRQRALWYVMVFLEWSVITYKSGQVFKASYGCANLRGFFFPIVPLLTSAIDVSDKIIAKLYTIDATRESRMAMQNFRIGRKISHKFEAEKADLLTKIDRKNTQRY